MCIALIWQEAKASICVQSASVSGSWETRNQRVASQHWVLDTAVMGARSAPWMGFLHGKEAGLLAAMLLALGLKGTLGLLPGARGHDLRISLTELAPSRIRETQMEPLSHS